jgi:hypothetical protein
MVAGRMALKRTWDVPHFRSYTTLDSMRRYGRHCLKHQTMSLHNCKVSHSFEIGHPFGDDDIVWQIVHGAKNFQPTDEALDRLAAELIAVLQKVYCVSPIEMSIASDTFQGTDVVD